MELYRKLEFIRAKATSSYWAGRINAEIGFAANLSLVRDHKYDALVDSAADFLMNGMKQDGVITDSCAKAVEKMLYPISADAKSYKIRCISHAHIDMNWMWGFQETVSVTVDTFRTVLELMREYPDLTFGQSQASTYRIIEEYAPEMLDEISERIRDGRWEVTASAWVEADKNMTGSESLVRHIQYSRDYLKKLFPLTDDDFRVDFEPDTFGHNWTMPEILADGGVKYLYHCRGYDGYYLYTWRARSGKSVLVYREPKWYNAEIVPDMFVDVPNFCKEYGVDTLLKVYGVGDHGGGPTRRDITRIIDMMKWPIQPTMTFGTYHAFFKELEQFRSILPVVDQELNYIFTGCYTSQGKIKAANRIAEARLYESEAYLAASAMFGGRDHRPQMRGAWEKVLFNHFHDILPGSGVSDTRQYALGIFQQAMAAIGTGANVALHHLAEEIDTSAIDVSDDGTISEGAGVGFSVDDKAHYSFPAAERGCGRKRIFNLFNPNAKDFSGVVKLTAWDWAYNTARIVVTDAERRPVPHKLLNNSVGYWGHKYITIAAKVNVPAFGYATYLLDEAEPSAPWKLADGNPRTERFAEEELTLENTLVRAVFDRQTMLLLSFTDKATGDDLICEPSAVFTLLKEKGGGQSAWVQRLPEKVDNLNESGKVRITEENCGGIYKWIAYEIPFGSGSVLRVKVSLGENDSFLEFDTNCDFRELGSQNSIPQLRFTAPFAYLPKTYRYDIPFATIDRPDLWHDVPALSLVSAVPESGPALMLTTDTKYGYTGHDNSIGVDLLRASCQPDPIPDYGPHQMRIGLGILPDADPNTLLDASDRFNHPISSISVRRGSGNLPMTAGLLSLKGGARVYAVKTAEDGNGIIVRLADATGKGADASLSFFGDIQSACVVDTHEQLLAPLTAEGKTVRVNVEPFAVTALRIVF